jgi:hypothetical protein
VPGHLAAPNVQPAHRGAPGTQHELTVGPFPAALTGQHRTLLRYVFTEWLPITTSVHIGGSACGRRQFVGQAL